MKSRRVPFDAAQTKLTAQPSHRAGSHPGSQQHRTHRASLVSRREGCQGSREPGFGDCWRLESAELISCSSRPCRSAYGGDALAVLRRGPRRRRRGRACGRWHHRSVRGGLRRARGARVLASQRTVAASSMSVIAAVCLLFMVLTQSQHRRLRAGSVTVPAPDRVIVTGAAAGRRFFRRYL